MSIPYRVGLCLAVIVVGGCQATRPELATTVPLDAVGVEAASLRAACRSFRGEEATACRDERLLAMLEARGVAPTMAVLERLATLDETVEREGHLYAHSIGLAALREGSSVAATFEQCTPLFQSGCYHGVIQAYFVGLQDGGSAEIGAQPINALCESYRDDDSKRFLFFQCAHGMGHGLTGLYGHDLPKALAGCDLIRDDWERQACYGGAFMENVVQATVPHHTVGRPESDASHEDHAAMGHDMAAMEPAFKALDPDDPLYPCNAIEPRYQYACYHMQTSAILFFNGGDVGATARACDGAPEAHRAACYQSLGRDISAYTLQDHERAARLCSTSGDALYRSWCHVGYAKNLVDLTASSADGIAYCKTLVDASFKRACYEAMGEQIWVLRATVEARRTACELAEPEYRQLCIMAAGVGRS